ncbi:MAG: CerR family C-terminal domain-containing protein [Deltaproteobacteria bacterium]|nr:CerR family C-terminal domain-containing protein [Deltaproteobacteria bacterium]
MEKTRGKSPDTRERLLQAAGEAFARSGFRNATVREISKRANANVAAVSYHFGDKEGLYAAVLRHASMAALKKYPPDGGVQRDAPPEQRLAAFIRSFLHRVLDEGRPTWHGKLMAFETADPTPALDQILQELVRPTFETLLSIVRELQGKAANDETVYLSACSVVGQCLHYFYSRPVIERLVPMALGASTVDRLAEHITRFSLAAMKGMTA